MNAADKHILIVEDSPDLQALLSQLFDSEGYSFSQAYNGHQALHLLNTMKTLPSLILLDIMMPVMDGVAFLEEKDRLPRLAPIPVVVMSADARSRRPAEEHHVAAFLQKPINDVEKLLDTVERHRHHLAGH